ncbi:hypothetical protein HY642_03785 [Candidatus Woesearchaeota archaeon]|nr:hypothetical protein [Candidatus Woesearchaeota archaeon]
MTLNTLGTPKPGKYDPNLAERLNKEAEEEARLEKEQAVRASENTPTNESSASVDVPMPPSTAPATQAPLPYTRVEFEEVVPTRRHFAVDRNIVKRIYNYPASVERLRAAGYDRHPTPQEALGLMIDGLEGRLRGVRKGTYENMISGACEWLSAAFERQGNHLIAYLDPRLSWLYKSWKLWQGKRYARLSVLSPDAVFDIAGKRSDQVIPLEEFGDKFVKFMYGRKFADLPTSLRWSDPFEGTYGARVVLPPEGRVQPVSFELWTLGHSLLAGSEHSYAASRGVNLPP